LGLIGLQCLSIETGKRLHFTALSFAKTG